MADETPAPIPILPNDAGPDGHILHSLTLFGEMLRRVGLEIGSGNMLDLVRATEYVPMGRRGEFYQAARSILVHRKQDLTIFDEAFQIFWRILFYNIIDLAILWSCECITRQVI